MRNNLHEWSVYMSVLQTPGQAESHKGMFHEITAGASQYKYKTKRSSPGFRAVSRN